jgi:Tfp pilus assembly protein PilZ
MWDGINKRRFPRANYRCLLFIKGKSGEEKIKTYTENIGVGGICVILSKSIPIFDEVGLTLSLEDSALPITCKGKVVWRVKRELPTDKKAYDTGIEFIDLKEEDKSRIEHVIGDFR